MSMHRTLLIGVATALIASAAVVSPAQAAPKNQLQRGTVITPETFGMHVAGAQNGVWPTIEFGSLRIWDKDTAWSHIEKEPGVFDWTKLDRIVEDAEARGVRDMMMVLAGTPTWASSTPTSEGHPGQFPGEQGMPTDLAFWDRWVEAVVTRYQGRITSYQPWNEANLVTFFNGTPAEMAELTKRTYDIVKRIDPTALVIAPSTGTRLGRPFRTFYPPFLTALAARGWPVDVFTAHTYPAGTGTPVDRQALIAEWKSMLQAAGAPRRPLWDTEINFGLRGPGPTPKRDYVGAQAQRLAALAYLDALRYGVSRAYWYYWSAAPEPLLGVQMTPGSAAARSVQTLEDWIVGARYQGCRKTTASRIICNFRKGGQRQQIVWSESTRRVFTAPRAARQVCNLNNVCKPIKKNRTVRTLGPVLFKR
jgi:polysaccharide biosynthesis protein PslG